MHIAEDGEGPLVVLCHGYPELWYSWRHQLKASAEAGYHVVAPDQRGYGQTDRPEAVEDCNILQLSGDIIGLVDALGETGAVIVGHDWGAAVAWHCALLRPDIFRAVVLLSVPYRRRPWTDIRPTEAMKQMAGEKQTEISPLPRAIGFTSSIFKNQARLSLNSKPTSARRCSCRCTLGRAMHRRRSGGVFCSTSRRRFLTSA
jgi:pimeloyl-ACP methyl ester carboxylesterase